MNNTPAQQVDPIFVNILRVCAALSIFLCHVCSESGTALGNALGQFFNIGVPIFFMLSGYLYSRKSPPRGHLSSWYLNRAKRILTPLYLFLAVLLLVHLGISAPISIRTWLDNFIPICGLTQRYISGCGHLWYITHILICYAITPTALMPIQKRTGKFLWICPIIYVILLIGMAYLVPPIWCTLVSSIATYLIGFFYLPLIIESKFLHKFAIPMAALSIVLRLAGRHFLDDTPLYTSVLCSLTGKILAISLILIIFDIAKLLNPLFKEHKALENALAFASGITYEFYIVHYIFLTGKVKITLFRSFALNALFASFVSIILAIVLHKSVSLILRLTIKSQAQK